MKSMMKRVSVILMTMIMTVTMIPASVFADEAETAGEALSSENIITSVQEVQEETAEEVAETKETVDEVKEPEAAHWKNYTLYNYISLNEGRTYISLNTQEGGITTPMSAEEFQRAHGNKRYDLNTSEYQIAGYDLSSLVITNGGMRFVERSVAKEGQAYFIARLDRVEAVRAANFRYSADIAPLTTQFDSLSNDHITFHRNWYITLVTPMAANQKLLTGRNRKTISAASILPVAGAVAAIILTQDMSGAMAMTDKWTAAMIVIAAVNVVLLMIRGGRKETAKAER